MRRIISFTFGVALLSLAAIGEPAQATVVEDSAGALFCSTLTNCPTPNPNVDCWTAGTGWKYDHCETECI